MCSRGSGVAGRRVCMKDGVALRRFRPIFVAVRSHDNLIRDPDKTRIGIMAEVRNR